MFSLALFRMTWIKHILVCLGRSMDLSEEGTQDTCFDGPSNTLQNNSISSRAGCLGIKQMFQAMNHCHTVPITSFEFSLKSVTSNKDILALLKIAHIVIALFLRLFRNSRKGTFFFFFPFKLAAVAVWSFGLLLFKKCTTFLTPSHLDHWLLCFLRQRRWDH